MTEDEMVAEMLKRLNDAKIYGMTHDAYLQEAVKVMFRMVAESLAVGEVKR